MKRKIKIHKEGYTIILVTTASLLLLNLIIALVFRNSTAYEWTGTFSIITLFFFAYFFRIPTRNFFTGDNQIIAPADGRIVVIEETHEQEYFGDKRIQVSIFMSPTNVHVNRTPISGLVK